MVSKAQNPKKARSAKGTPGIRTALEKRRIGSFPALFPLGCAFPKGQSGKQNHSEKDLQNRDIAVSRLPAQPPGEAGAHNIGTDRHPHAPEGMEPAHMPGGVVHSHIVVERGVHRPRPQSIGNGPQTDNRECVRDRKSEERGGSQGHADRRDQTGPNLRMTLLEARLDI